MARLLAWLLALRNKFAATVKVHPSLHSYDTGRVRLGPLFGMPFHPSTDIKGLQAHILRQAHEDLLRTLPIICMNGQLAMTQSYQDFADAAVWMFGTERDGLMNNFLEICHTIGLNSEVVRMAMLRKLSPEQRWCAALYMPDAWKHKAEWLGATKPPPIHRAPRNTPLIHLNN